MTKNKTPLGLTYDNLVVGSSLEAILFAYQNNFPIIYTRLETPYYFETIEDFELGTNKLEIWNKYIFLLSLAGLCPFSDKLKFLRYKEAGSLRAITEAEKVIQIKFNNLYIFDDHNFHDLPLEKGITTNEIMMLDWMKVISGKHHDIDIIYREDPFISKLIFYLTGKEMFGKQGKDCLSVSYLKEGQQYRDNYAEYMVRLKTQKIMEENGIKQNHTTKLATEHIRRDIIKLGRNLYDDFDNVKFMYMTPKDAWFYVQKYTKINYPRYLKAKLGL